MNEDEFNSGLRRLISRGDLDLEITDAIADCALGSEETSVSAQRLGQLKSQFIVRIQDDALRKGKTAVGAKVLPFGRLIEAIREQAHLTRIEIANRLGKDETSLLRVEWGDVPPTNLRHADVADVLSLFNITIKQASAAINASLGVSATKQGLRAAARSHGGIRHDQRGADVEKALDAIAARLRQKKAAAAPTSESTTETKGLLDKVTEELKRKGRSDLLT